MRTSYSYLSTFRQCPQKFKFQVIDKIKAPKSVEAVFGTSVHDALRYMFSHDPLFPTLEEILAHFESGWRGSGDKIHPVLAPELLKTYEESGKVMIKNFYKKNPPWNFSVIDTESRFEVLLEDNENGKTHTLAGIIDRIDKIGDGEYEIIDYKTSRRLPSQSAADENLQMAVYHMAITKRWPNTDPAKIKLSLYFLKHNEKISSSRSTEALAATSNAILKTIKEIEKTMATNSFPPIVSVLCDYCPYKQICPAWKHFYKDINTPPPDEAQLQSALQEYFAIKESENKNDKRLKELQGIVGVYMDANKLERVFDDRGYYISRKLQQRFKFNFDKVKEILLAAGLEDKWQAILEADEKKLKAIMSTLPPHMRDDIASQKFLTKEFFVLSASTKPIK